MLILPLLWGALFSCSTPPSPAQKAYQSLKRIELRTNRLVWHEEYLSDLEQAKTAVGLFLSQSGPAANTEAYGHLQAALFDYELAGKLWDILRKAGQNGSTQNIQRVCLKRSSTTGGLLLAYLQSLGSPPPPGADGCSIDEVEITAQVTFLWKHAEGQLKLAAQDLNK